MSEDKDTNFELAEIGAEVTRDDTTKGLPSRRRKIKKGTTYR